MWSVTDPHAHIPRSQSQRVAGPDSPLQRQAVGRGRAPDPRGPTPRQESPSPWRPPAAPTTRNTSSHERSLWGW